MNYVKAYKLVKKMLDLKGVNDTLEYIEGLDRYERTEKRIQKYLLNTSKQFVTDYHINYIYNNILKSISNEEVEAYLVNNWDYITYQPEENSTKEYLILLLLLVANLGGQDVINRLDGDGNFQLTNPAYISSIYLTVDELFKILNNTTVKQIANKITEAKKNLLTVEEAKEFVLNEIINNTEIRGKITAFNEVSKILNNVQEEAYFRAGVELIEWVTTADERVCQICSPLNGKRTVPKGNFEGGYKPPAHIGCRCFLVPVNVTDYNKGKIWTGN